VSASSNIKKLSSGTRVFVFSLQREGKLIEKQHNGEWTIIMGAFTLRCHEALFEVLPSRDTKNNKMLKSSKRYQSARNLITSSKEYITIDLHGMRIKEAIGHIETQISTAIVEQRKGIELVHGLGTGRLQEAIHDYLAQCDVIARYHLEPTNPGKTWVHFY
jgi:DNA mismatch repair protein MutS2